MATITLSISNGGQTVTASATVSDANATRMVDAFRALFPGRTNQQIMNGLLRRVLDFGVRATRGHERRQTPVEDIPVT